MRELLERLSGRREYRLASMLIIVLGMLTVGLPLAVELDRDWLLPLLGTVLTLDIGLVVLTYFRLRNASLSKWWLLPIFMVFPIGPTWEIGSWEWGSLKFTLSGLVALIPVVIGWFAAAVGPKGPSAAGTLN